MAKKKKEDQEDWETLAYRMDAEGFDYCFDGYSDWKEIKDEKFQELRKNYIKAKNDLEKYIKTKVVLYDERDF